MARVVVTLAPELLGRWQVHCLGHLQVVAEREPVG